jgi:hypothetical protein
MEQIIIKRAAAKNNLNIEENASYNESIEDEDEPHFQNEERT